METTELLQAAIVKVRQEYLPQPNKTVVVPEPHTRLYESLQIFDLPDEETVNKVKYINEYLSRGNKNSLDMIIDIHTKIGALSTERLTDRIYKYCKLREIGAKAKQRYENIEKEIHALGNTG